MVTAGRLLFAGTTGDRVVLRGAIAAVVTAAVGPAVGIRTMRRST